MIPHFIVIKLKLSQIRDGNTHYRVSLLFDVIILGMCHYVYNNMNSL